MFHHLRADQRGKTLREACRVLAPGGSLHLLDFERPKASPGGLANRLYSSHHLKDNSEQRILALLQQAGFASVIKIMSGVMLFGLVRIAYYQGSAPTRDCPKGLLIGTDKTAC